MTEAINRIVLPGDLSEGPAIPDSFRNALRQYDPSLIVAWNPMKRRHVIEQCIEHLSPTPGHSHICRRNYVLLVQDADGFMMPLGDRVMDMVKERDVSTAGYGPGDLARFQRDTKGAGLAEKLRREKEGENVIRYASRHNRRQLRKAIHLMQQHSLDVNQ